jgi:uncharacterized protein (DUF305 family)
MPLSQAPAACRRNAGAQFDRGFLRYQVMHHEKDVTALSLQAKEGHDRELRS